MGQTKKEKIDPTENHEKPGEDKIAGTTDAFHAGVAADLAPASAVTPVLTLETVLQAVCGMGFVSKDAFVPAIVAGINDRVRSMKLEETVLSMQSLLEESQKQQAKPEGIDAVLVAGMFNCPVCNMRLDGPSGTSVQGKGIDYSHPFGESPKLNGGRCEYQGRKFKTPTVFLELQPKPQPKSQPLTAATE